MSYLRVFVLMAGLTALFGVVGRGIGGQSGMVMALVLAGITNFLTYFGSTGMVLRAYQARAVGPQEAPELQAIVDRLRQQAGLPMPVVAFAPHAQPNAFTTGRNPRNAVVCITEGLLQLLEEDELESVLAHELGHVKNRDILLQTVSAALAGAITSLAGSSMCAASREGRLSLGPLGTVLAPIAAMVLRLAISRQMEFEADAAGARISGKPLALASALEKLEASARRTPMAIPPAVAPLAQVYPLAACGGAIARLFRTHPSTAERVARLRANGGRASVR